MPKRKEHITIAKSKALKEAKEGIKLRKLIAKFRKKNNIFDVNDKLKKHLKSIIKELIRKESRKEALEILSKSDRGVVAEFLFYYYSDMGNIACMEIDRAKGILVKKKVMKQKKNDSFKWEFDV